MLVHERVFTCAGLRVYVCEREREIEYNFITGKMLNWRSLVGVHNTMYIIRDETKNIHII